jgi:hypothetical protein
MDKKYICYCGLYCENCAVKVKIQPAAKTLYEEMKKSGFEEIINYIPGGDKFWPFLKNMADPGICVSCIGGGGNPACAVRICAKEKGVEICALCDLYPCDKFDRFFAGYRVLMQDNILFREHGIDAWAKVQDERMKKGFTYTDENEGS